MQQHTKILTVVSATLLLGLGCRDFGDGGEVGGADDAGAGDGFLFSDSSQPDGGGSHRPTEADAGAADGAVVPWAPPGSSGSRLRRVFYEVGGSRIMGRIYDSELETFCSWQTFADGVVRCVPDTFTSVVTMAYSDAACTKPYFGFRDDQAAKLQSCGIDLPFYIRIGNSYDPGLRCSGELAELTSWVGTDVVYRAVRSFSPEKEYYYHDSTGSCGQNIHGPYAEDLHYEFEKIDQASLATGTIEPGTESGRFRSRLVVSSDGLKYQIGLVDSQRDEACSLTLQPDGKHRCLPVRGGLRPAANAYADAACSDEAQFGTSSSTCGAKYGYVWEELDSCETAVSMYMLGARVEDGYIVKDGVCTATSKSYYKAGVQIDPAVFGEGTIAAHPGAERIRPYLQRVGGLTAAQSFWDSQHQVACWPARASDGLERCLPLQRAHLAFSDASCTKPIILGPACKTDELVYVEDGDPDTCTGTYNRIFAIGAKSPATTYYRRSTSGCTQRQLPGDAYALYEGTEQPASAFEVATLVIE